MGMEDFTGSVEKIKPKYHYTYTDNKVLGHPVIKEFDANDDIDADEKFALFIRESGLDLADSEMVRSVVKN